MQRTKGLIETMLDEAEEKGLKEGLEQGNKEGIEKGIQQSICDFIRSGMFTDEQIAAASKRPIEFITELRRKIGLA